MSSVSRTSLSRALLEFLKSVNTPTVCNALVTLDPGLKGKAYTLAPFVAADPSLPPMVGFARTARIISSERPTDPADVISNRRLAYYKYVARDQTPVIAVMQDCGKKPGFGCIWGEINVALHQGLGVEGAITNGAIRDLGMLSPGFQLLGGNVCPGSGFAHLIDFGSPVELGGVSISPDDLIHADHHGAAVIPHELLPLLQDAIELVLRREKVLLDAAKRPGFDHDQLVAAWAVFEATK